MKSVRRSVVVTLMMAAVLAGIFLMCVSGGGMQTVCAASGRTFHTNNGIAVMGTGSAEITINGNSGQTLAGKVFRVYKLFDAENAKGGESINYTWNPDYEQALKNVVAEALSADAESITEYMAVDYIQSLNVHQTEDTQSMQSQEGAYSEFRYFVEKIRNEMETLGMTGDEVTVTQVRGDNSILLSNLEYGYYIVDEITAVDTTYAAGSLCMVNTANPAADINVKSDYPSIIKKICEDDNKEEVGDDGWNDVADFEIGQIVPYKYVSDIPDMNGYDTYYYAWHDVMDEALTFDKESVRIVIRNGEDEYEVSSDEFVVTENAEGETFVIEITDIKAIIDREFDKKDSLGHNTYDQTVVLTYEAMLNDIAAENTGRPGFENDVRLEFSNNPDQNGKKDTGYTPWDTVVCFTYKLNVQKVNNHDQVLENAKFR